MPLARIGRNLVQTSSPSKPSNKSAAESMEVVFPTIEFIKRERGGGTHSKLDVTAKKKELSRVIIEPSSTLNPQRDHQQQTIFLENLPTDTFYNAGEQEPNFTAAK